LKSLFLDALEDMLDNLRAGQTFLEPVPEVGERS